MQETNTCYLLIGCYSPLEKEGIYVYNLNTETGELEYISGITNLLNPSYLTIYNNNRFIYAVSESGVNSAIYALSFDIQSGKLKFINSQPTFGEGPCHVLIDKNMTFALTTNYRSGNLNIFPVNKDGSLNPLSQVFNFSAESHMHMGIITPDNCHLFATDLGKDKIYKFDINTNSEGDLIKQGYPAFFSIHEGAGPRHMTFHPNGNFFYCINELDGTISCFTYFNGNIYDLQHITSYKVVFEGKKGGADIHISPNGKFLYASNRLHDDGIVIFRINEETGILTNIGYQQTHIHPRSFIITSNGKFLLVANQHSNTIQVFRIDPVTGMLSNTEQEITTIQKPVCLKIINK